MTHHVKKRTFEDYSSNLDTFDVQVYQVISSVGVRTTPTLDKSHSVGRLEIGQFVSGVVVQSNFLKLESGEDKYVPLIAIGNVECLHLVPMEKGLCFFRMIVSMDMRFFPDHSKNCKIDHWNVNVAANSMITGLGRVHGQFGDIFVRIQHEESGKYGWVFCSKKGRTCMQSVDPPSTHQRQTQRQTQIQTQTEELTATKNKLDSSSVTVIAGGYGYELIEHNRASRVVSFRRVIQKKQQRAGSERIPIASTDTGSRNSDP